MKNIIIVILGVILALLIVGKTYSGNGRIIFEEENDIKVYKFFDGDTRCYVSIGSIGSYIGHMNNISCVRVR